MRRFPAGTVSGGDYSFTLEGSGAVFSDSRAAQSSPRKNERIRGREVGRIYEKRTFMGGILDFCVPSSFRFFRFKFFANRSLSPEGGCGRLLHGLRVSCACGRGVLGVFDSSLRFFDKVFSSRDNDKYLFRCVVGLRYIESLATKRWTFFDFVGLRRRLWLRSGSGVSVLSAVGMAGVLEPSQRVRRAGVARINTLGAADAKA